MLHIIKILENKTSFRLNKSYALIYLLNDRSAEFYALIHSIMTLIVGLPGIRLSSLYSAVAIHAEEVRRRRRIRPSAPVRTKGGADGISPALAASSHHDFNNLKPIAAISVPRNSALRRGFVARSRQKIQKTADSSQRWKSPVESGAMRVSAILYNRDGRGDNHLQIRATEVIDSVIPATSRPISEIRSRKRILQIFLILRRTFPHVARLGANRFTQVAHPVNTGGVLATRPTSPTAWYAAVRRC